MRQLPAPYRPLLSSLLLNSEQLSRLPWTCCATILLIFINGAAVYVPSDSPSVGP